MLRDVPLQLLALLIRYCSFEYQLVSIPPDPSVYYRYLLILLSDFLKLVCAGKKQIGFLKKKRLGLDQHFSTQADPMPIGIICQYQGPLRISDRDISSIAAPHIVRRRTSRICMLYFMYISDPSVLICRRVVIG